FDTVFIYVNHWPSRISGKDQSEKKRIGVSLIVRESIDSIFELNANAKIIVMGDFNDEPTDNALQIGLNAKEEKERMKSNALFNPFIRLSKNGEGTIQYHHQWQLFDQILVSEGLSN